MQRRGIITRGTWCVDRNRTVESWPTEKMLAEILSQQRRGGGSACNLTIDVKKLDPPSGVSTTDAVEPWQTCLKLAAKLGKREPLQYVLVARANHWRDG